MKMMSTVLVVNLGDLAGTEAKPNTHKLNLGLCGSGSSTMIIGWSVKKAYLPTWISALVVAVSLPFSQGEGAVLDGGGIFPKCLA